MQSFSSSGKSLPPNPSLRHLKLQAKNLLTAARSGDKGSLERIKQYFGDDPPNLSLAVAQLTIAREYGFASWTQLKISVENQAKTFAEKLDLFLSEGWCWGDRRRAMAVLQEEPTLAAANIYSACVAANYQAVHELIAEDVKLATKRGGPKDWPPILYAAWSCYLQKREDDAIRIFRLLLEHGADPNSSWRNAEYGVNESALYGCIEANCDRAARALLEAGADPNDGESLYHACEKGNLALLQVLGEYGLKSDDVSYCIKHAIDFRWEAGIQWFLDQGADPNAVHPAANETSLHWAIKRNCSLATIQSLLAAGADPNARTKSAISAFPAIQGWTPYDFALRLGRKDVARLLEDHGAVQPVLDVMDQFVVACANADRIEAERLVAQHPDLPQRVDQHGRTLIAHVAQMKNWEGVRLMVDFGWSPEQDGGWMNATPLTWALCYGDADAVDFLLSKSASPIKDVGGYFGTPLHTILQCRWGDGNHVAALERLLQESIPIPTDLAPSGNAQLDALLKKHRRKYG